MKIKEEQRWTQNKGASVKIREAWQVCIMHANICGKKKAAFENFAFSFWI